MTCSAVRWLCIGALSLLPFLGVVACGPDEGASGEGGNAGVGATGGGGAGGVAGMSGAGGQSGLVPEAPATFEELGVKGVEVDLYSVDGDPRLRAEMIERAGRSSVPQIFIGGVHVGGCDDLYALDREGKLDSLLAA